MGQGIYQPRWVIVGTTVNAAPTVGVPATPVITNGVLTGPYGIYRVVNATTGTDIEATLTPPTNLYSIGTPGDSLTIYRLQFSSQSPEVALPVGSVFEDWSWLTVGNTFTEVDARYSRETSTVSASVVTDADAPSGKAVQWGVTTNAHRWARSDDFGTFLAGRTTETVQFLVLFRLLTTATYRGGLGHTVATDQHTGIYIQRNSSTNHAVSVQGLGSPSTPSNTALIGTYNDGDVIWIRAEVSGTTIKGRSWLKSAGAPGSVGEPTGWTTYTAGSALAFTTLGPMTRNFNPAVQILYYSAAIDGTAPGPI
jgi:hypothetical protein